MYALRKALLSSSLMSSTERRRKGRNSGPAVQHHPRTRPPGSNARSWFQVHISPALVQKKTRRDPCMENLAIPYEDEARDAVCTISGEACNRTVGGRKASARKARGTVKVRRIHADQCCGHMHLSEDQECFFFFSQINPNGLVPVLVRSTSNCCQPPARITFKIEIVQTDKSAQHTHELFTRNAGDRRENNLSTQCVHVCLRLGSTASRLLKVVLSLHFTACHNLRCSKSSSCRSEHTFLQDLSLPTGCDGGIFTNLGRTQRLSTQVCQPYCCQRPEEKGTPLGRLLGRGPSRAGEIGPLPPTTAMATTGHTTVGKG